MNPPIVAVDHFAGAGGWSVAARRLGIVEYGTEIMREAIRTRSANGFRTIYRDVWSGLFHPWLVPPHEMKISSPPCQTFSLAGNGEGRDALSDVLQAIDDRRYVDVHSLFALTKLLDPRTALVLTPLAHVWAHRPRLVALEQVPQVLPVWNAIASVLRTVGYSVWTGILSSEMYGVPQTRQRAILMARLDGVAEAPVPTHSRYYPLEPHRFDPGVLPWVSMAEALGWGMTERPSLTVTSGGAETGGYEPFPTNARAAMEKAQARGAWIIGNQDSQLGRGMKRRQSRHVSAPAQTVTGQARTWKWADRPATTVAADPRTTAREHHEHGEQSKTALTLTRDEAATLQSFPDDFIWRGSKTKQFLQIGNAVPPLMAGAVLGALIADARERNPWEQIFAEVAG
ncbi:MULTISPECIES: DNA cytosine methyltransferase [unclassified Microbacterium]|uniref:DNA cytosine methyltransferase n=1 Tax=unclassified Microbacterium TaxID=2609290 RepID=UPI0030104326